MPRTARLPHLSTGGSGLDLILAASATASPRQAIKRFGCTRSTGSGCLERPEPGFRQPQLGGYLRVGVRPRLNRTADLDSEADAAPGLKRSWALRIMPLAEPVERGCAEVIVTTNLDPLIVTALPGAGIERRSRAEALPRSQAPTESRGLGQRQNSVTCGYGVLRWPVSRVKRADLPAFWVLCPVPGVPGRAWCGRVPGCRG